MNLRVKFNLVLLLSSIAGIAISAYFSHHLLQKNAQEEVLNSARIMMESAIAVRSYTVSEIKPLLVLQQKRQFIKQSVPAYAANQYISQLQKKHPDYSYREATLNPTNPRNRAVSWEADIINSFRNNDEKSELIGQRETPTGPVLYLSRPIKISNPQCLACHDTPDTAPKTLIQSYGTANGFNWKLNEVIGAQIVSVPMLLPLQRAEVTFYTFLILIVSVFTAAAIVLNILLHYIVIKPILIISNQAEQISQGKTVIPELDITGSKEITTLGHSFNLMHRSLLSAFSMLEDDDE